MATFDDSNASSDEEGEHANMHLMDTGSCNDEGEGDNNAILVKSIEF